jgi:membrane protein required for colicin V production
MNFLDILICIPLVWGLYKGITKGFIIEAANTVALFLGVWVSVNFSDKATAYIQHRFDYTNPYLKIIVFCALFISVLVALYFIGRLLTKIVDNASLGILNKIAGAIFGAGKFLILLSVLFFVLNAVEKSFAVIPQQIKKDSLLYSPISKLAPILIPGLGDSKTLGIGL